MPTRRKAPLWALRTPIPAQTGRILGVTSVVLVLAAWCVCSYVMVGEADNRRPLVPYFYLPAPDQVVKALIYLIYEQDLFGSIRVSALRIIYALTLSVAVAFPLGLLMASFEVVNRFFDPLIAPLRYLPITAFIPLLILWFGIDEQQKVAFLFLGTVVYLLPAVVDAIRAVPDEMVQTAYTLGASKFQAIYSVLIPAALPQIFDGFRVMNAIAWTYIILAEMVNAKSGIGYLIFQAGQRNKTEWLFAGILVVGVIGILTDVAIRGMNRLLFAWREVDA
ncbi:MAG: ABC transporter permease [Myxococcaceae bacterium]|nr:ABC transporter permease [Myxococcaceae bacterium]